jgi:hypothetical protein
MRLPSRLTSRNGQRIGASWLARCSGISSGPGTALLVSGGDLVLGQHRGQVHQRQAVLSYVDHVMQPLGLVGGQPVGEGDHQAVQSYDEIVELPGSYRVHVMPTASGRVRWS